MSNYILETLEKGQSFDEIAALQARCSSSSAEALCDCSLMHIDLSIIHSCENAYQELSSVILSAASCHLDEIYCHVEQLIVKTGAQRLSSFLVDQSGENSGEIFLTLPFKKIVLAGKLSIKPESLSRAFKRLNALGVKCAPNKVSIQKFSKLRTYYLENSATPWAVL